LLASAILTDHSHDPPALALAGKVTVGLSDRVVVGGVLFAVDHLLGVK